MDQRLNLGSEIRELKLGSTFNPGSNSRTSFHTLKYDFKPASVDLSKVATLDVGSNNQVTVTVPHLDSSGVPKTVFKGNQRNYTKECVIIIDKVTGEVTLERLHHNIQVKKTRSESSKAPPLPIGSGGGGGGGSRITLENSTQRTVSKTKVSTGYRKTAIGGLGGIVQRHSPIQGSPSYPLHKSPQQAPAWNANNTQSTLPSIPMIGMDDDMMTGGGPDPYAQHQHQQQHHQQQHHQNQYHQAPQQQQHHHKQPTPPQQQHQPQYQHHSSSASSSSANNIQHQQQKPQPHPNHHYQQQQQQHNTMMTTNHHNTQPSAVSSVANDIGVLSSSDSSSDSDSSGSGSDSDEEPSMKLPSSSGTKSSSHHNNSHNNGHSGHSAASNHNHMMMNGGGGGSLPALLLNEDLRLSDSNSSDSDD